MKYTDAFEKIFHEIISTELYVSSACFENENAIVDDWLNNWLQYKDIGALQELISYRKDNQEYDFETELVNLRMLSSIATYERFRIAWLTYKKRFDSVPPKRTGSFEKANTILKYLLWECLEILKNDGGFFEGLENYEEDYKNIREIAKQILITETEYEFYDITYLLLTKMEQYFLRYFDLVYIEDIFESEGSEVICVVLFWQEHLSFIQTILFYRELILKYFNKDNVINPAQKTWQTYKEKIKDHMEGKMGNTNFYYQLFKN